MSLYRVLLLMLVMCGLLAGLPGKPAEAVGTDGLLVVRDSAAEYDLAPYTDLLEDREGSLSAEDVLGPRLSAQFKGANGRVPNFGYGASPYWARIVVRNESPEQLWLLTIAYPPIDWIDLYVADGSGIQLHKQSGDLLPFGSKDVADRNFTFRLHLKPQQETVLLIRFQTEGALTFPMRLIGSVPYAEREQTSYLLLGGYYGVMLIMTVYNSVLAITLRSRAYMYYVLINASTMLLFAALNGTAYQFVWPDAVWWNNRSIVFFMCLSHMAALLFTRNFLNLRMQFPRLYHLFTAFVCLEIANIVLLFIHYPSGLGMSVYTVILLEVAIIIAGILSCAKGLRPARYFLVGWGVFMIGAIITLLSDAGLLIQSEGALYASQVSSTFEALILSWGLADRIQKMRIEKEQAVAQMNESRKLADSDELTGLYNRRYILSAYERISANEMRPVSFIIADLDHFKRINDTYGHDGGDEVLQEIACVLKDCFRPTDIVGRFGGEEFIVLLPDTNLDQARSAAEYLLNTVRRHKFAAASEQLNCTISIGIAERDPILNEDFHQVLRRADQALYEAKRAGRNRICRAETG